MAQTPIREYDAKRMFAAYTWNPYHWFLVQNEEDFLQFDLPQSPALSTNQLTSSPANQFTYVIKPDQLFGKRGKYGLLGINLDTKKVQEWWKAHHQKEVTIEKQSGKLDTFLVEPFVPHAEEYYIAIKTERNYDEIFFSKNGGVDVEENWDLVQSIKIPLSQWWKTIHGGSGVKTVWEWWKQYMKAEWASAPLRSIGNTLGVFWIPEAFDTFGHESIRSLLGAADSLIEDFILTLYSFFVDYGFTYLEVNPFTKDDEWHIICLDMVARVDTCEAFKQKEHWQGLAFVNPFGIDKTPAEKYIDELDASTGASLKFRLLNPLGRIWLLTSGGGASVIIADTIGDMGYTEEVGNYGECSGNPDRENTYEYTKTLLETMLAHHTKWKYLVIAGAIANFTHIDKTFSGIIDAFRENDSEMKDQEVKILVRRGGINDTKWLKDMQSACEELGLPCEIADWNTYMTDILEKITLKK